MTGRYAYSILVVGFCLLSGCMQKTIYVSSSEFLRHVPEFRDKGEALVQTTETETISVRGEKVLLPKTKTRKKEMTLAQLLDGCPDVPPFANDSYSRAHPCAMRDLGQRKFEVAQSASQVDWGLVLGFGLAGAIGGVGVCVAVCEDKELRYPSIAALSLSLGYLFIVAIGHHNSR